LTRIAVGWSKYKRHTYVLYGGNGLSLDLWSYRLDYFEFNFDLILGCTFLRLSSHTRRGFDVVIHSRHTPMSSTNVLTSNITPAECPASVAYFSNANRKAVYFLQVFPFSFYWTVD